VAVPALEAVGLSLIQGGGVCQPQERPRESPCRGQSPFRVVEEAAEPPEVDQFARSIRQGAR
jgi:hypothetical protein